MWTFVGIKSPPWSLPAPLRWRIALCPSLFFFFFQLPQSSQCLFEIRSVPDRHSVGTYLVRTNPPITFVIVKFLWSQMVGVVFVRKVIHLATKFFGSANFYHIPVEFVISYSSVVDTLEILLFALLLELMGDVVFFVSWLLPVTVPVRSPFLYMVVRKRKQIHRALDEFLIFFIPFRKKCPHMQKTMPLSQYDEHTLCCISSSASSNSHSSMFPISRITCFDFWLKGLNDCLCCRYRWKACRFGWFSIFWINSRTLALCNCFTVECAVLEFLQSMSSSILSRISFLSVLSVLISWCTSRTFGTSTLFL